MQNNSIRQSLLLWLMYNEKLQVSPGNYRWRDFICKIEKTLKTANIEKIHLFHKTEDYFTLKYSQEDMEKIVQFTMEEVKSVLQEQT